MAKKHFTFDVASHPGFALMLFPWFVMLLHMPRQIRDGLAARLIVQKREAVTQTTLELRAVLTLASRSPPELALVRGPFRARSSRPREPRCFEDLRKSGPISLITDPFPRWTNGLTVSWERSVSDAGSRPARPTRARRAATRPSGRSPR